MPYVIPTPDQFKARFPAFADQDDEFLALLIQEASNMVDTSWREEDYQTAIMYLAAHLVATDASADGDADTGEGLIASESFGPLSVAYRKSSGDESSIYSLYTSTVYGRRFLGLLRLNKPSIVGI